MQFIENEVKEIGPGVWIRVAIDNISWYDLGNGAAVVDALEEPDQAEIVRGLIKDTTGQELKYVVTTHWDKDHIACNPQWKREGAVVIAHQSCAESAGDWQGRPDISYQDNAVLQGEGARKIEMQWMGGTHTPWDTVLYFPAARVLHIADLFGWGLIPCRPTPAKIARLQEIFARILNFDADAVICGHGPICTMEHLRRFYAYLEALLQTVPPLVAQGMTLEQIETQIAPPDEMRDWWRFVDWKHKKNLEMLASDYHE